MDIKVLKVVAQSEPVMVPSKREESGQLAKCMIKLKELGGDYEGEYSCAMFGNVAQCKFEPGTLVLAALRFTTHEVQGAAFNDVIVTEIHKL